MRRLRVEGDVSLIDRLSLGAGRATVVVLIIMMLLITVEVFIRKSFGVSTRVAQEFSGYLLVAIAFWGAAEVLRTNSHIKITLLTERLSQKGQSRLNKANHVTALALVLLLLWASTSLVVTSYRTGMITMGIYQIPVVIPQLPIPIGLFFLALQLAANIFRLFRYPER